jgi:hypothetical protein
MFFPECAVSQGFFFQNVLPIMIFSPECAANPFWEKTWLAAHSGEKHGWQHILGKT